MTWATETSIEDACSHIIDYRGKTPKKSASGIRLITAKVVKSGRINEEPAEFIAENYYDEWMRRGLPELHDVVITTEAPLGEVGLIREEGRVALGQRVILLRGRPDRVDQRFLHLLLQTDLVQSRIAARGTGTTVVGIKQSELRRVLLPLPRLDIQRSIASIVGAYDDLIELNRRRVALLEDMARGLFEEWFVRFRFPGHEHVPMVDTPAGLLPEGWASHRMDYVVKHAIGGTWGQDSATPKEDVPACIIRGTDFPGFRVGNFKKIPNRYVSSKSLLTRTVRANDIILEASGGSKDQPVGRALLMTSKYIENFSYQVAPASFCKLIRVDAERSSPHAVFWHLDAMYNDGRIETYQTQSTGLRNFKFTVFLDKEMIIVPDKATLVTFDKFCEHNAVLRSTLALEIQRLRTSRDLLLPRLISGQLTVAAAERQLLKAA